MRKLIWILLGLGMLWGGYWFVGSSALEKGLTVWLSDTNGRSWTTSHSSLTTKGFPNRFDTTVRDIEVATQNGDLAWSAPFFQIFALSYKPNHIVAVWPNEQTITLPRERLAVSSTRMRGSVVFEPDTSLALDRAALEVADLGVQSNRGWSAAAQALQFNSRQTADTANAHDVFVQVQKLRPTAQLQAEFDPDRTLPDNVELLQFDGVLVFDNPWDRAALETHTPQLDRIEVKNLQIVWGDLDFSATGNLTTDARGYLEGELAVTARNWQAIYQILTRTGLIQDNFTGPVESILSLMALESDNPDLLQASWIFQGGRMRFGAIPLGPAPFLIRR